MTDNVFRFRVGEIAYMVIADSTSPLLETDVQNSFAENTDQAVAAFREFTETIDTAVNILLLESARKRILIDSGSGNVVPEEPGKLVETLRAENIAPESINTIVITHYHMDHIGGLLDANNNLQFPNAHLVVPAAEHAFVMDEEYLKTREEWRVQRLHRTFDGYARSGGLELIDDDREIEPGIRYMPAPGHTPGHSGIVIESGGERVYHIVDTVHMPFQLYMTHLKPRFDVQPEVAIATRRAILDRAAKENLLIQTYHLGFPGLGHIRQKEDRLVWMPYSAE